MQPAPMAKPMNEPNGAPHFPDGMSYKELHMLCKHYGYRNRDARPLLIARLLATRKPARKRAREDSEAVSPVKKRRSVTAAQHSAFATNKEVVKHHGHWWDSAMRDSWGALPRALVGGVDSAISAWTGDLCNKALGKELPKEDERKYGPLARAAQERELRGWKEFDACRPKAPADTDKTLVDVLRVLTWKVFDGKTSMKARLVVKGFQDPDFQRGLLATAGS